MTAPRIAPKGLASLSAGSSNEAPAPETATLPPLRPAMPLMPVRRSPMPGTLNATRQPRDWTSMHRIGQSKIGPRLTIIGQEGVGKSSQAALLPNPVFLCAEDGLVGEQFNATESYVIPTWNDILDFASDFVHMSAKWLVIDTLDWVEGLVNEYVVRRDSTTEKPLLGIEDYGYSKGYGIAAEEFRRLLQILDRVVATGKGVLFLVHSKVQNFKNPLGPDYDRFEGKVSRPMMGLVREWSDAVGFAHYDDRAVAGKNKRAKGIGGGTRVIEWSHCAAWDAKCRLGFPMTMAFEMPQILPYIDARKASAESPEQLIAAIAELAAGLPEDLLVTVQDALVEHAQDVPYLVRLRNRVVFQLTENQE